MTKRSNFFTGKDLLAVLPKEPDIWGVGLYERNYDGKTFERSCHLSASTFCLRSNGISIFDRINGSCAHGLSFGGYRVRQILTRICVSSERFVKPFFSLMKKKEVTAFHQSLPVCMKQIMAGKRLSAVFVPSKYCLPSNGRKIVK